MSSPFSLMVRGAALPVVAFEGRERMQRSSVFHVELALDEAVALELAARGGGSPAQLQIDPAHAEARRPTGVVTRVTLLGRLATTQVRVRITLESALARLRKRARSRIFQDASSLQIVAETLAEHRIPYRTATSRPPKPRAYCVQYRERDERFLYRILAEDGLFFFVDDPLDAASEATVVIADDVTAYRPIAGTGEPLQFRAAPLPSDQHVTDASFETRASHRRTGMRAYDAGRPRNPLDAGALSKVDLWHNAIEGEVDDYEEDVERSGPFEPDRGGWSLPSIRAEQRQQRTRVLRGTTACRRAAVGHATAFVDYEVEGVDGAYVFVDIAHRGQASPSGDDHAYQARFAAVPASVPFRPKPPKRRVVQVAEPATVVGHPAAEEGDPHTDAMGRVKVRFPWDLRASGTERDSTWLRVLQPWAGQQWGTQFIPRVGMEVLVTFLGGNVDCPVVMGSLPNGLHLPPFPLPDSAATSGIRTRSTPGGRGFNELAFVDRAGAEVVSLRAQRDFARTVLGDETSSVGGAKRTSVARDYALHVHGDSRVNVSGGGDAAYAAGLSAHVGGSVNARVGEELSLEAGGAVDFVTAGSAKVQCKRTLTLEVAGDTSVRAGGPRGLFRMEAGHTFVVAAGDAIHLTAQQSLTLSVGASKLTLSEDAVEIDAPNIFVRASEKLTCSGNGPSLELSDKAELVSSEVNVCSETAQLKLDKDALVRGRAVSIKGPAPPPTKSEDPVKDKRKPFKTRLADAQLRPYADRHYLLLAGKETLEGETGVDGEIDIDIPDDTKVVDLTVWTGKYPTSPKLRYQIELAELPPPDSPEGAQLRLKNLGYYNGDPNPDWSSSNAVGALAAFQIAQDLAVTSALDGPTVAKLVEIYGE